jgi:hypothetical protein
MESLDQRRPRPHRLELHLTELEREYSLPPSLRQFRKAATNRRGGLGLRVLVQD